MVLKVRDLYRTDAAEFSSDLSSSNESKRSTRDGSALAVEGDDSTSAEKAAVSGFFEGVSGANVGREMLTLSLFSSTSFSELSSKSSKSSSPVRVSVFVVVVPPPRPPRNKIGPIVRMAN